MCLAIPGEIEKISDNNYALVDFGGIKKQVCLDLLKGVRVGDYVNVHVGFAINKIDEKKARQDLNYIQKAYGNK